MSDTAPQEDTHLIADHDQIGEAKNWCGAESFKNTETFAETTCLACLKTVIVYAGGATERLKLINPVIENHGREELWGWFELSYAGFLTIPRVLMHEMPDAWQGQMAALLRQYSATFPNWPDGWGTRVQLTMNNYLAPMPPWLTNYRHPDKEQIQQLRGTDGPTDTESDQRTEPSAAIRRAQPTPGRIKPGS